MEFQSTLPAWGETPTRAAGGLRHNHFNPLSPHGERLVGGGTLMDTIKFQSTLPAWGETTSGGITAKIHLDFNPLSPHGERRRQASFRFVTQRFQSTLPAWGETRQCEYEIESGLVISIHSPRMGRDLAGALLPVLHGISIHSPRMGRDLHYMGKNQTIDRFQSTLPAWGETAFGGNIALPAGDFNPLSPHGERPPASGHWSRAGYFNPLSPHGERRISARGSGMAKRFQSTLPAWGETWIPPTSAKPLAISIHSPRMGRDPPGLHVR